MKSLKGVQCEECRRKGHVCQAQIWAENTPLCLRCADGEACCFETARSVEIAEWRHEERDAFAVPSVGSVPRSQRPAFPKEQRAAPLKGERLAPSVVHTTWLAQTTMQIIVQVQVAVASHFGIGLQALKKKQTWDCLKPRQIAMFLARETTGASYPVIGRAFGGHHHTTVLHSLVVVRRGIKIDTDLRNTLQMLLERISAAFPLERISAE